MILHLPHLALFPLGVALSRVIFILTPPRARARREVWSNLSTAGGHQGKLWAGLPEVWTIRCAVRTRFVQLLSGFVGTVGWSCWSCFTIVETSCNRDSKPDRVFSEKEYPSLTVRACDGLSWDTPAGYKLLRAVPVVMWQMGIC